MSNPMSGVTTVQGAIAAELHKRNYYMFNILEGRRARLAFLQRWFPRASERVIDAIERRAYRDWQRAAFFSHGGIHPQRNAIPQRTGLPAGANYAYVVRVRVEGLRRTFGGNVAHFTEASIDTFYSPDQMTIDEIRQQAINRAAEIWGNRAFGLAALDVQSFTSITAEVQGISRR